MQYRLSGKRRFNMSRFSLLGAIFAVALGGAVTATPVQAQVTAYKQAVAEAASRDEDIAAFYRARHFAPIWTGEGEEYRTRRAELLRALSTAQMHGLPEARYSVDGLLEMLQDARTPRDQGLAEVALSDVFLRYARDIQTGVLVPSRVDSRIVRKVPYRDRQTYLKDLLDGNPAAFFRALPPRSMEYNALMKEKLQMEALLENGGWGRAVNASKLSPGDSGVAVIALRDRMIAMGYLTRSNTRTYNDTLKAAVQRFQLDHGLTADGVAGTGTIREINKSVATRLQSVVVALERERWMNKDRGARHILVNIPDFTAKVMDDGDVTFVTRAVVGALSDDRPTPEFSDVMEHMVINPSWYVPRSIITKEYLPLLKRNAGAVGHIEITDRRGRKVNRGAVDFSKYTARSFPYSMRQPPSPRNALGLVKFMFPNKHNIYLHDTPAKNLFSRDVRAFSHGCVRLAQPFDFAYTLLAKQTDEPQAYFQRILKSGRETKVNLETQVPVHIIYRTAFTTPKGQTQYRADIYGRDARIWSALSQAGVVLGGVQG